MDGIIFFLFLGVVGPLMSVFTEVTFLLIFLAILIASTYLKPSKILKIPIYIGLISLLLNVMIEIESSYWRTFDFSFLDIDWVYLVHGLFILLALLLPIVARYNFRKFKENTIRYWKYYAFYFVLIIIIPLIGGINVFFPSV